MSTTPLTREQIEMQLRLSRAQNDRIMIAYCNMALASLDRQPTGSEREVAERIVEAYIGGPIVCEHHGILASEITLALTNARVSALAARPEDGGGS